MSGMDQSQYQAFAAISRRAPPLEAPTIKDALYCARPVANETGAPLFDSGDVTLHQLLVYIAGPCLGVTVLSSVFLIWRHLHRYTAPQEQRQIIRIVSLPMFYALFNFLALCWYQYYLYIQPLADLFEAVAVAAMFLLTLEYVAPDGTDREKYFDNLEARNRRGRPIPGGSLVWFQNTYASCLQYPFTKLVFTIIVIVTQYYAVYCQNSFSPKHAHLYLQLADWFFIGGALGACIGFVRRFRQEVDPKHRMRPKAWSFVGIVLFQLIQGLLFHLLCGKLFHPTAKATFNDINFGIPSFMTCVEAVIFSLIFHWSFSSTEYRAAEGAPPRKRTLLAIRDALNISDILAGTWLALQLIAARIQRRAAARSGGSGSSGGIAGMMPPGSGRGPRRQPTLRLEDQTHLDPLADRSRARGWSDSSESETGYGPEQQHQQQWQQRQQQHQQWQHHQHQQGGSLNTEYLGVQSPAFPRPAHEPSLPSYDSVYRANEARLAPSNVDGGYSRLDNTRSLSPSPNGLPRQDARSMV